MGRREIRDRGLMGVFIVEGKGAGEGMGEGSGPREVKMWRRKWAERGEDVEEEVGRGR